MAYLFRRLGLSLVTIWLVTVVAFGLVSALPGDVEAARALGGSHAHVFLRHVVPNMLSPMLVVATASLGGVIVAEASLSFLGIGMPPPTPSWGAMVSGSSQTYMREAPWLVLAPGLALTLAVLAFNFLGDGVRDLADPRLRRD